MAAREGRTHETTAVGSTLVDGNLGAGFDHLDDRVQVGEVDSWAHTLRVKVQSQGNEIDVARPLPVAARGLVSFYELQRRGRVRTQTDSPLHGRLPPSGPVLLLQYLYRVSSRTTAPELDALTTSAIVVRMLPKIVNMLTIQTRETGRV